MQHSQTPLWRQAILTPTATLQQAAENLNQTGLQIVLVVTDDGVLRGTLTDGDIRRGLLRGCTMQTLTEEVMFDSPLVAPPEIGREMVLHLMKANSVRQLPVVDDQRRLAGLHLWDSVLIHEDRPNSMVIMAGGQGKRLRPQTEACPKPMLPVAGKPMLEHILERAKGEGFRHFLLSVNYLGHMVEDYFGGGEKWDVSIDYVREDSPMGTAGALGLLPRRPDCPFVVTNGDVLTDIHYAEILDFHIRHGAIATMAVREHEWQHPFGVVRTEGIDIVGFEEKPVQRTHVNAGIYVIDPSAIELLESGARCDMPTLFLRLQAQQKKTIAYPMHEPWLDVGRQGDLELARSAYGQSK